MEMFYIFTTKTDDHENFIRIKHTRALFLYEHFYDH